MADRPGFARVIAALSVIGLGLFLLPKDKAITTNNNRTTPETYRLIHALGDTEEIEYGLSKTECEERKRWLKLAGEKLGTYSETLGIGSIVCIPDSSL